MTVFDTILTASFAKSSRDLVLLSIILTTSRSRSRTILDKREGATASGRQRCKRSDRRSKDSVGTGRFKCAVDEFAVGRAKSRAGLAQPFEALALVGKRLLHPRQAVDLAPH